MTKHSDILRRLADRLDGADDFAVECRRAADELEKLVVSLRAKWRRRIGYEKKTGVCIK